MNSLTLAAPLSIIIEIGRPCITTCGRLGDYEGWYQKCQRIREQRCGPVGFYIKRWRRRCYYMRARVGWWWDKCWMCWKVFITWRHGRLREWRLGVCRMKSGSTPEWMMRWRTRSSDQSRNTSRYSMPPSWKKWPAIQSMSCALGRNGCRGLVGWWGGGTRTWDVNNNNPERSVV